MEDSLTVKHSLIYRCGQPAQQHGRRFPFTISVQSRSICFSLVSCFLTEVVQQIHSLRASGVKSFQAACALPEDTRAARRSVGTVCTTPDAILVTINSFYQIITQRVS